MIWTGKLSNDLVLIIITLAYKLMDWQERTGILVGKASLSGLAGKRVAVVGLGGVGAYAAEMLVRAGIGHMVVLDYDIVSYTDKNRQLLALDSTIGKTKCDVLKSRLCDINPGLDLVCIGKYILADDSGPEGTVQPKIPYPENSSHVYDLLSPYQLDYVIDAIDTLGPKLSLIKYCIDNGIPLVSSMGAGAKFDITKIAISDISATNQCPLAHMVRKRLHKIGIRTGFQAVYSEEVPLKDAIVHDESCNKKSQVGTISYLPAAFGCCCAQAVICGLLKVNNT